jgi:hypothetical protein
VIRNNQFLSDALVTATYIALIERLAIVMAETEGGVYHIVDVMHDGLVRQAMQFGRYEYLR